MKKISNIYIVMALLGGTLTSCHKDLDLKPTNDITADVVYTTPQGYKQSLAKVYSSFALTGGGGTSATIGDIGGIDQGTSDFLRLYWNIQELASDEALCAWQDPGIPELNFMTWNSNNVLLQGLYARSLYQITVANDFIRESMDDKLAARGIEGADAEAIRVYSLEARFLRAYQYWVLMDLFGNPPFVTEEDPISKTPPRQISREDLFNYIESELLAIEGGLTDPQQNEYGRVDKAASWMLLARLYLNAEVYLGSGNSKYTQAIEYASKVINSGYILKSNYRHLFLADNDQNRDEIILSINYDAIKTQNYGGTTFLINSSTNGQMNPASFGIPGGGWGGNRSKSTLPGKFSDISGNTDKRAMFFGTNPVINDVATFAQGLAVTKFRNVDVTGAPAPSNDGTQCSVDFPLFRLADAYLIYAEAVLRGGEGGSDTLALEYVNKIRERAYGNSSGNINNLSLDFILDERAREFYWEAYRRTDLIRFGKYTDANYVWPFKGGTQSGAGVQNFKTIFPLPALDVISNPNLTQNAGY